MSKERTEKVIKEIAENAKKSCGKRKSTRRIIKDAGFSQCYADNPKRLLETKTAKELMRMFLPDWKIYSTHGELMAASEIQHYVFPKLIGTKGKGARSKTKQIDNAEIKGIVESVPGCKLIYIKRDPYIGSVAFFQAPDNKSRREAVDMAYKLKGNYSPEKIDIIQRKYQSLSNAELMEYRRKLIEKIRNKA
jgi:hypothetical protein